MMTRAEKGKLRDRFILCAWLVVGFGLSAYGLYSLHSAWRYGLVYGGATGGYRWIAYDQEPGSFVYAVAIDVILALVGIGFTCFVVWMLVTGSASDRRLDHWKSRPPLDDAIRKSADET